MKKQCLFAITAAVVCMMLAVSGCSGARCNSLGDDSIVTSGSADKVKFAVAWSTDPDPAKAGCEAATAAIASLGCRPRGVVFYTYYQDPGFVPDEKNQATACKADVEAEIKVAKAVDSVCGSVPNIGCRARTLTNGGTLLKNAVGVLAIGGSEVSVSAAAVPILDNRRSSGERVALAMKNVKDLKMIIALAEMRLSFEAKDGVSVEDFIRGVVDNTDGDVTLFGGNAMPDDMTTGDLGGAQFFNGKALKGHVAAMGIGGPVKVFSNHNNEFKPSPKEVKVTEAKDKWVVTMDDKPAVDVYRQLRQMKPDEQLTSDWQHPIGVVVGQDKEYIRMVLNWVNEDGTDKDGKATDMPKGSLCFVAPVVEGRPIRIMAGGDDAKAIVAAARQGIEEVVADAKQAKAEPALCLLSNCCARGMRLRTFRTGNDDEVPEAIIPALGKDVPLLGFYAWGELGRIKGQYQGMSHQYQQHTFVSALVAVEK